MIDVPTPRCTAALLLGLGLILASGCQSGAFNYVAHSGPRVSVIHRPIHPEPGTPIQIVATAEAGASSIARIEISLLLAGANRERTCSGSTTCTLSAPATGSATYGLYSARAFTVGGAEVGSPAVYVFTVGRPNGVTTFPIRAPFFFRGADFDVLLVRDAASYPSDSAALTAAEDLIYDGVLSDPAYRWRDDQLAFHYTINAGATTGANSGLQNRCGQEPWQGSPLMATAETEAAFAEAIGVIHANAAFRDCSGLGGSGASGVTQGRFAADGGQPRVFQHELGHALFGLGDEYTESTASRQMPAGSPPANFRQTCCCCMESGSPTGGGLGSSSCGGVCTFGEPSCAGFVAPASCYTAPAACPSLEGDCVHPNVFRSLAECASAAAAASSHPGVEAPAAAADCRVLCSNADPDNACPCDPAPARALWILDRHFTASGLDPDRGDVMAQTDLASWHGAACERCTETAFCLLWEQGRGQTAAQAEAHCLTP